MNFGMEREREREREGQPKRGTKEKSHKKKRN